MRWSSRKAVSVPTSVIGGLGATERLAMLCIALLLHIAHGPSRPDYHLRGPSRQVCHLTYMSDLWRSPLLMKSARRPREALLFYLEWSRTPSPRCPRPPNAHALRTKLMRVKARGGDPGLDHLQKYFFDSLCFLEWTCPF